jgi:hypothetical protein
MPVSISSTNRTPLGLIAIFSSIDAILFMPSDKILIGNFLVNPFIVAKRRGDPKSNSTLMASMSENCFRMMSINFFSPPIFERFEKWVAFSAVLNGVLAARKAELMFDGIAGEGIEMPWGPKTGVITIGSSVTLEVHSNETGGKYVEATAVFGVSDVIIVGCSDITALIDRLFPSDPSMEIVISLLRSKSVNRSPQRSW